MCVCVPVSLMNEEGGEFHREREKSKLDTDGQVKL